MSTFRTIVALDRQITCDPTDPETAAFRAWQAHVDAGRIGGNPPADPAIAARRDATAAQFAAWAAAGFARGDAR